MLSETLCASLRQIAAARRPWRHSPRTEKKTQEKVRKEICAHSENAGLSKRPLHEKKKKIYGDTNSSAAHHTFDAPCQVRHGERSTLPATAAAAAVAVVAEHALTPLVA
jgi:hypothetical protein